MDISRYTRSWFVFKSVNILLVFLLFFSSSCKKNEPAPNNNPNPDPTPLPEFAIPETTDIVMYEVNLRAFSGRGDIQGIIQHLNHIKSLGVNVIWLMPIHPIGEINSVNSPYSVKDYKAVNPEFGTLTDLKTLISESHKMGMAVILDWVANHTAWDNQWISINKDWYTQDGNGNIISPPGTNWADVADLNYNNQEMRLAMIESMNYWVQTADVDGFRCDAADMVPFDFWKQAIDSLDNRTEKDLIFLAEGARYDHFNAGFDLNFSWDFYNRTKQVFNKSATAGTLFPLHQAAYEQIPYGKHQLRFTTNHDESAWDDTPMVIFGGKDGALAASVATIFMGGVPLIYSSQEVGVEENIPFFSNQPINWLLNPDMLTEYQEIMAFYNTSDAARKGELVSFSHPSVICFTSNYDQEKIAVIINTRDTDNNYILPGKLENTNWTNVITGNSLSLVEEVLLTPYEYLILAGI